MPTFKRPTSKAHNKAVLTVCKTFAVDVVDSVKEMDGAEWDRHINEGTLSDYIQEVAPYWIKSVDDGEAAPINEWELIDYVTFLLVFKYLDLAAPEWVISSIPPIYLLD